VSSCFASAVPGVVGIVQSNVYPSHGWCGRKRCGRGSQYRATNDMPPISALRSSARNRASCGMLSIVCARALSCCGDICPEIVLDEIIETVCEFKIVHLELYLTFAALAFWYTHFSAIKFVILYEKPKHGAAQGRAMFNERE